WGAQPGTDLDQFQQSFRALALTGQSQEAHYFVAGVWRDYARQTGALVVDSEVFAALTGERGANDLALWPAPDVDLANMRTALTRLAKESAGDAAAAGME